MKTPSLASDLTKYSIKNKHLEVTTLARGVGQTMHYHYALNRWNRDLLEDRHAYVFFIHNKTTNDLGAATPFPFYKNSQLATFQANEDSLIWNNQLGSISSTLTVTFPEDAPYEKRTLQLTNHSTEAQVIEITSFLEVALHDFHADAGHPAFSKLFIQTEFLEDANTLIATRRPRGHGESFPCMYHTCLNANVIEWESDRTKWLGRGHSLSNAKAHHQSLTNSTGTVLDPAMSLRAQVTIPAGKTLSLDFILGVELTRDAVISRLSSWKNQIHPASGHIPHSAEASTELEANADLLFGNSYGGFSKEGDQYIIRQRWLTDAHYRTPMPWVNVIGHEGFGCVISESASPYTWSRNSQANRLSPWSNDPITDPPGEAIWLRDDASGEFISLGFGPKPAPVDHETKHGFGYSKFTSSWDNISHELTYFIPAKKRVRIARLKLSNQTSKERTISLFAYEKLAMAGLYPTDQAIPSHAKTNYLTAQHPNGHPFHGATLFATTAWDTTQVNGTWHGTTDRTAFLGMEGFGVNHPAALTHKENLKANQNTPAQSCFAQQLTLTLKPHQTFTCAFLFGEVNDEHEIIPLHDLFSSSETLDQTLEEVIASWKQTLNRIQVKTPLQEVDVMINGWLAYQALVCRIQGRSAYYQSGGAFGYRDQLQDASCLIYMDQELTRNQLLLHARNQFSEGDVLHWWHPEPISRGLRTKFSDDLLWLPYATLAYIKHTGDHSILDELEPFYSGEILNEDEDERYIQPEYKGETGSLFEHCCRALNRALTKGENGLPLIGTGDWNDGMSRVGRLGKGESVWLGFFIYDILNDFIPLCRERNEAQRADQYETYRVHLLQALNSTGWDGEWYRRAYYDNGVAMGSKQSDECKIDVLAQAWAVISKAAPSARAESCIAAAKQHLVDPDLGITYLLTPPFADTLQDPGYIKGYVAGVRENGGQYTHAASWFVKALAEMKQQECVADYFLHLLPIWQSRNEAAIQRYKVEPYVIAADIYTAKGHHGRGGWTWYTGSAAWVYRIGLESLLGLSIVENRFIYLKPCIPSEWTGYEITYLDPTTSISYQLIIKANPGHSSQVDSITMNGEPVPLSDDHAIIPLCPSAESDQPIIIHITLK